MSEVTLTASTGRETGTRPSRRLRREDLIPGVVSAEGKDATIEVLEAEVRLDKPLGGRQVVDQEGRAIPES